MVVSNGDAADFVLFVAGFFFALLYCLFLVFLLVVLVHALLVT